MSSVSLREWVVAGRGQRGWLLGVLLAAAVGTALRLYRAAEQVLTGDELHALNGAVTMPLGEILRTWTYHGADYSVPLTAFFRLLIESGAVLGEMSFRAPVLCAGVLTIVVLPYLLRPRIGRAPTLLLAWLIAISPMLVLYSRVVRSYALVIPTAICAALAFERWWRTRSRGFGSAYVALAAMAIYLHLGAAPLVLSPFLFAAGITLRDWRERRKGIGGLAGLLAAVTLATALLLFPAQESLLELSGLHGLGRPPSLETWLDVLHLQVGTTSTGLLALFGVAVLRGAVILARRDRDFALFLLSLVLGYLAGLAMLAPNFLQAMIVASRYLLILLPLLLTVGAVGLATPWTPDRLLGRRAVEPDGSAAGRIRLGAATLRSTAAWQTVALTGLVIALFASGPLARAEYRWSSFTHAQPFMNFIKPGDSIPRDQVPRFYLELPPGDEAILEFPWSNVGTHSFNAYQHVHRRPLVVGSTNRMHDSSSLALRNTIRANPDAFRHSHARYVVVHVDLGQEENRVTTSELRHGERLEKIPELWALLRMAGLRMATRLHTQWGAPVYSDALIRVWDLDSLPDST